MTLDFTRCPLCGAPFNPVAIESVICTADINLFLEPDGTATVEWGGTTNYDNGEQTTLSYECGECHNDLPESYQAALDGMLGNTRRG